MYERGLCEFDENDGRFEKLIAFEESQRLFPRGHAFQHRLGDHSWVYFGEAAPHMRVPNHYESLIDPSKYERVESDAAFVDTTTGKPIKSHNGAVAWNPHRKKWISIFTQEYGDSSYLGEIWYAEAESPAGPWRNAVKIVTHDRYSFYNPGSTRTLAAMGVTCTSRGLTPSCSPAISIPRRCTITTRSCTALI